MQRGWLPTRLMPAFRPELAGSLTVRWMDFGAEPLAEPFFEETRARLEQAGARQMDTDAAELLRLAALLPPVRPAGLIFHVSRCGSTLLANALRAAPGTSVVSEDAFTARLLQPFRPTGSAPLEGLWNKTRRDLAEAAFRCFGAYRTGQPERVVLKLPSFATVSLPLVRQWWPEVPCVVVIRDPEEVMVANLASGFDRHPNPQGIAEVFGMAPGSADESPEELCARTLHSMLSRAREALGENCRVVDYEDLKPRIPAIARLFGIPLPEDDSVRTALDVYSKGRGTTRPFVPDRSAKREKITPEIREAARRWARGPYADLRAEGARPE